MKELKNYGFLGRGETPNDWVFGSDKQIGSEVLQNNGQWDSYLPQNEIQNNKVETMACVSFSALNCLEILFKRKYGYEMNWSDRFTSKMSGTTKRGNYMYKVAESIRKHNGFVKQELWKNEGKTWDEWYKEIPANIKGQGERNKDLYEINYEWVYPVEPADKDALKDALKYAPLQISVCTDWYKRDGIWYQRKKGRGNHCVTLFGYEDGKYWKIFDHYRGNEIRYLEWDFRILYPFKFNINKITNMRLVKSKENPEIYIINPKTMRKTHIFDMQTVDELGGFEEVPQSEIDKYNSGRSIHLI